MLDKFRYVSVNIMNKTPLYLVNLMWHMLDMLNCDKNHQIITLSDHSTQEKRIQHMKHESSDSISEFSLPIEFSPTIHQVIHIIKTSDYDAMVLDEEYNPDD